MFIIILLMKEAIKYSLTYQIVVRDFFLWTNNF